jgi:cytoskeletal protein CcmA (bactofilin family)
MTSKPVKFIGLMLGLGSVVGMLFISGCNNLPFIPDKTTHYFSRQDVENFTSSCDLVMNGTNVSNYLKVNGKFEGSNSRFKNVDLNGKSIVANSIVTGDFNVNGDTKLDKVTVYDNFHVTGELTIMNSWIKKPFDVRGSYIKVYNSAVKDIIIKKSNTQTVVEIHGGSQVKGNIVFESGAGKVYIDKKSKVHGSIIGGNKEDIDITLG